MHLHSLIVSYCFAVCVLTIPVDIIIIILSPIFYTTRYCGDGHIGLTHQTKAWAIAQSLPFLLISLLALTKDNWAPRLANRIAPRGDNVLTTVNFERVARDKTLPQLHFIQIRDGRLCETRSWRGGGDSLSQNLHQVTLNKSWRGPGSTRPVAAVNYEPNAPPQRFVDKPVLDDMGLSPNSAFAHHAAKDMLEHSAWRQLHPQYYSTSRYSVYPPGGDVMWGWWRGRVVYYVSLFGIGLSVVHCAVAVWGTVLLALHWADSALCQGNQHLMRLTMFILVYHWWVWASLGALFIAVHRWPV